jgi:hypothetical protein
MTTTTAAVEVAVGVVLGQVGHVSRVTEAAEKREGLASGKERERERERRAHKPKQSRHNSQKKAIVVGKKGKERELESVFVGQNCLKGSLHGKSLF